MEDIYNPSSLKRCYDKIPHGKPRIDAIRSAIAQADANNDVPFRVYFREELCREACFYTDVMEMMVVFPEILAIIDKYPDTPVTQFEDYYINAMDHVIWVYKWVIEECSSFYQVPAEDCFRFFEDFKRRSVSIGYNLKPYYMALYKFYSYYDKEKAEQAFAMYEVLPRDDNSNCEACERNLEIGYYLKKDDYKKAKELSVDIENFKLTCGDSMSAWLRMKIKFLDYYMDRGEFAQAGEIARLIERNMNNEPEYQVWYTIINCYVHIKPGKALRLYKKHWKEMQGGRNPEDSFDTAKHLCCFFKVFEKHRMASQDKKTVRLGLDSSFPLYNKDGIYKIDDLYRYYYNIAETIANKFDKRNNSDSYIKNLKETLKISGAE